MIANRLVPFLEARQFFSHFQAGFRAGHSTTDQLFRLFSRIKSTLSSHSATAIASLDIVAAFDKVWHGGLLVKLFRAGVQGRMWRWIKAFLSDRSIRVSSSNCFSSWFTIGAGVPQGSVLGPLLFLVYLNDLPVVGSISVALFADDIAIWSTANGRRGVVALNAALHKIYDWSLAWHVSFSISKSVYLVFSRRRAPSLPPVHLFPSQPPSHTSVSPCNPNTNGTPTQIVSSRPRFVLLTLSLASSLHEALHLELSAS